MLDAFARALPRNLVAAAIALALVNALDLVLGGSWAEVRAGLGGDLVFVVILGAALAAFDVWRARRTPRPE